MDQKNIVTNSNQPKESVTDDIEMKTQHMHEVSLYKVKCHNNNEYYTPW